MQKVNKLHNLPCKLQLQLPRIDDGVWRMAEQLLLYKSGLRPGCQWGLIWAQDLASFQASGAPQKQSPRLFDADSWPLPDHRSQVPQPRIKARNPTETQTRFHPRSMAKVEGRATNALHLNFIISLLAPIYGHGLLGNLWS